MSPTDIGPAGRSERVPRAFRAQTGMRGSSGDPELPRTGVLLAGCLPALPYLAAVLVSLPLVPGSSGAAAFTTSSANFRWLVSSCWAKS
jgi:hypothetical protein